MASEPRFWKVQNEPYTDEVRHVNGWYWRDEQCEEPMGPFTTRAEAESDYLSLRVKLAPGAAANVAAVASKIADRILARRRPN